MLEITTREQLVNELRDIISIISGIEQNMHLGLDLSGFRTIFEKLGQIEDEKTFNESYARILQTFVEIISSADDLSNYTYKKNCQIAEEKEASQDRKSVEELSF